MTLLFLACVQEAPLPDLGDCASYPSDVYEYGQIGIGTCLAGPADIVFLSDGKTVALTNANPWLNFTGGSVWTLDTSAVDMDAGRNVISELGDAVGAMDMPNFSGAMEYVPEEELLLVTNRMSEDARTREADDALYFIDVSAPIAPQRGTQGDDGGATLTVGYDPNAVLYDGDDRRAFVVDRTSHTVAVVDLSTSPATLVDPGSTGSIEADDFVDTDGSGSTADFVTLSMGEATELTQHHWDLRWSEGNVRMWLPNSTGAYRLDSVGGGSWTRSDAEADIDAAAGEVTAITDPDAWLYTSDDGTEYPRLMFVDDGAIRVAYAAYFLEDWSIDDTAVLEGSDGWDAVLGGPNLVEDADGLTWMFYDGGDGTTQSIGAATTTDGATFDRYGSDALFAVDGASVTDPFVLWDTDAAQWWMFYTVHPADGAPYTGAATSTDLVLWSETELALQGQAPAATFLNGTLLVYTAAPQGRGRSVLEHRDADGLGFGAPRAVATIEDAVGADAPGIALQAFADEQFAVFDETGDVFSVSLAGGDTLTSENYGFTVRAALGFHSGPDDVGDAAAAGIQVDSWVGDTVWGTALAEDLTGSIVRGTWDGEALTWVDSALEAGAGGDFDADSVFSPVVVADAGGWTMYYAGSGEAVTSIGRATSTDGVTWTADASPVLSAEAEWETVEMVPGSVAVTADGAIQLWYSGYDGSEWRIGVAESTDGVSFTRVAGAAYAWTLDSGTPGDWDDSGVRDPYVVIDGDTTHLWYSGYDGSSWQVGYSELSADGDFSRPLDADGGARPVIEAGSGSFGAGGVARPVARADADGFSLFYAGLDADVARVGRAAGADPEHLRRSLRMPTSGDTWGFTTWPEDDTGAIDLDQVVDDEEITARGCTALAEDEDHGYVYVACKLLPLVFVIDVRDDSTDTDPDLNYLDLEAVMFVTTTTDNDSGFRDILYDSARGHLWGVMDDPEGVYALRVDDIVDDDGVEFVRDRILATLPLPRADERDRGVDTQASVGPGSMVMHPDGRHLFVTNFNHNSVTAFDLDLGPYGMEVGEASDIGENPYGIALSPDGSLAVVGNYAGEVVDDVTTNSTLALLDTDPDSPTFMSVRTWVVNR